MCDAVAFVLRPLSVTAPERFDPRRGVISSPRGSQNRLPTSARKSLEESGDAHPGMSGGKRVPTVIVRRAAPDRRRRIPYAAVPALASRRSRLQRSADRRSGLAAPKRTLAAVHSPWRGEQSQHHPRDAAEGDQHEDARHPQVELPPGRALQRVAGDGCGCGGACPHNSPRYGADKYLSPEAEIRHREVSRRSDDRPRCAAATSSAYLSTAAR